MGRLRRKGRSRTAGKIVGKQYFLGQPDGKNGKAYCKVGRLGTVISILVELRHHLLVVQYGTSDQVWKVRDEQDVVDEAVFGNLAGVSVSKKRDLSEGEEGNSDWQDNAKHRPVGTQDSIGSRDKKVGVLVVTKQ